MSNNKLLKAAGLSIASNIFVQILSRGLTFFLGAVTLKYLESSALLGIINVRLALLYSTLQFLSREPFRRGCIGEAARCQTRSWRKIVNTIWLNIPLSLFLALPLALIWQSNAPKQSDLIGTSADDYTRAIYIICLAALVENLAEPCYIFAQAKAITDHNPRVEIVFVMLKCFLTTIVTVLEANNYKSGEASYILTKIATCQLTAAIISVTYSYGSLCSRLESSPIIFMPNLTKEEDQNNAKLSTIYNHLDEESLKLSFSFVTNTILKQLLTEGERYLMTFFNVISLGEQGIYDVINNLGSLTARLIFKPIEEGGYTLFSQTVERNANLDARKFFLVQRYLMHLIKFVFLFGLIVLTFGYNYVPLIVIYGGEKLDNQLAFSLMRWQLFYTPILALNGMTESFTYAIMDASQVRGYNLPMVAFSVIFLASSFVTQNALGSACFIFSNCLMMLCRISISYTKISAYFKRHGFRLDPQDAIPSLTTTISLGFIAWFLHQTSGYLDPHRLFTLALCAPIVLACLIYMAIVIMFHEEELIDFIVDLFKRKKQKVKKTQE